MTHESAGQNSTEVAQPIRQHFLLSIQSCLKTSQLFPALAPRPRAMVQEHLPVCTKAAAGASRPPSFLASFWDCEVFAFKEIGLGHLCYQPRFQFPLPVHVMPL